MKPYHPPPDGYQQVTACEECAQPVMYGPVIGGASWMHVGRADHDVVLRPEGWWDVGTGQVRHETFVRNEHPQETADV